MTGSLNDCSPTTDGTATLSRSMDCRTKWPLIWPVAMAVVSYEMMFRKTTMCQFINRNWWESLPNIHNSFCFLLHFSSVYHFQRGAQCYFFLSIWNLLVLILPRFMFPLGLINMSFQSSGDGKLYLLTYSTYICGPWEKKLN